MEQPNLVINWTAIIVAMVAAFFFGFLWYGPIFGKTWAKAMGMNMDCKPEAKVMVRAFTLQILGLLLTTYVLAHTGQVWRPSVWGVGEDQGSNAMFGLYCGFFTWLGFYIPMQFSKVSWENRPWKVFFINTGHDFINLQIMAQILSHLR